VTGQTILITGGSGTFGAAMTRYALEHGAARVICLSRGEHRQAQLRHQIDDPRLETWIGDVRDRERLRWAFRVRPDVVIHAAALKRVEVCEQHSMEAVKTNVDGTRNVVEEAMLADVPTVLVISSDKATSPETTYGKTKAAAEDIALSQNAMRGSGETRVSVVRYGNVAGSQGSFIETLLRARQTGEPVRLTDPAATRFWWDIEAAVAFVADVLRDMRGAEIWIPRLPSARMDAFARALAPNSEQIVTGMRGSEKVHEAMINATESAYCWELPDRFVLLPKAGQWWSPEPPAGAVKVQAGFSYASDHDPTVPEVQDTPCPTFASQ